MGARVNSGGRRTGAVLCCINPPLNRHPQAAPPFLEAHHLAENNNALAVQAVPYSELRSARGITCTRSFRIEPALNVTAVTLKIIRGFPGFHI
jgi:hypothetical protein